MAQNTPSDPHSRPLFRLTSDPLVNEAAAELTRRLRQSLGTDVVHVTDRQVHVSVADESDAEAVIDALHAAFKDRLRSTHILSAVGNQVNAELPEEDSRRVPRPNAPFPGSGEEFAGYHTDTASDVSSYQNDRITEDVAEEMGILDSISNTGNLYKLNPEYTGNPNADTTAGNCRRVERYIESLAAPLNGDPVEPDKHCALCGSTSLAVSKAEDDDVVYNQAFSPWTTESTRPRPNGMRTSLNSQHSGRCVACNIAGMFGTLMRKPYQILDARAAEYRVFGVDGTYPKLLNARTALRESILDDGIIGANFETVRTGVEQYQLLSLVSQLLRHANRESRFPGPDKHYPITFLAYKTTPNGGPNGAVRKFDQIHTYGPDTWLYALVAPHGHDNEYALDSHGDSERFWPMEDVLSWYGNLKPAEDDDDVGDINLAKERAAIADGLIEKNPESLITRGLLPVHKYTTEESLDLPGWLQQTQSDNYFNGFMRSVTNNSDDRIDEETLESIKRIASSLGAAFHSRDDIGVATQLSNASSRAEFIDQLESACLELQKRRTDGDSELYTPYNTDDIDQFITELNQVDRFENLKQMFMLNFLLSAQQAESYQQHTADTDDENDTETDTDTAPITEDDQ